MSATFLLCAVGKRFAWTVSCLWLVIFPATAADWPQYRGPNHDAVSTDYINKQWSGTVTNPVWLVAVTNGLGSLVVSGGRVFTQIRWNLDSVDKEVCVALSVTSGAELWATEVDDASYPNGGVGYDDGPRSTPSVDGDSVYVLSSYLKLYRLNATNGAIIWSTNLVDGFGGNVIAWQNAASPLVDNGLIFVNANGGTNRILAVQTSDGTLAWSSQNEAMTHSTPVLATIQGVRQLIFATQSGLVSLYPQTGVRLWKFNYPFAYSTSLAVSPVVDQDMVFVCGAHAYGMKSVVMRATFTNSAWTTTQLWTTNNPASHWMTPVARQGFLYGQFGIQQFDSANAQFKCIDMGTGAVKWSTNGFGRCGTILVDDYLITLTEIGELVLVKPDTNAYTEVARFLAIPGYSGDNNKCWNFPAVSAGQVYVRSTAYGARFDFSVPPPGPALKLDAPERALTNRFHLTVRTADGTPLDSNRLATMELLATTNLSLPVTQWNNLTSQLIFTNGVARVTNVDGTLLRQFFIISEPY